MAAPATPAAVCRPSAAPDGTHRRGPCHQHCSPSAVTVRHPQPHDSRLTRAVESTIRRTRQWRGPPAVEDDRADAMPDLPTGTVTFLFTDVDGSTRLLLEHG